MIFGTHLALDNGDHVLDGGPNPPTEWFFTKRTTSCVMHNGGFTKRTTSRSGIFGTHLALDNSDHVLDGGPNTPLRGELAPVKAL